MSHAGLGLREEPLEKSTLSVWDLGHEPSPLHIRRLKSQHDENSSSTSIPALSVSCTPPFSITSLIMSLGPGVLVSRIRLALLPPFSLLASLACLAFA